MKEADLQSQCIQLAEFYGMVVTRVNSGMQILRDEGGKERAFRGGSKGTSDLIGCMAGRFVACELKVGRNVPTFEQQAYLERIAAAGGVAVCCWTADEWQAVLEAVRDGHTPPLVLVPPHKR